MTVSKIFVNLPVENLDKSIAFFTKLGFTFNSQFTDETATCMILSDTIFAMLISHDRFKEFTNKEICNAHTHTEVLLAIQVGNKELVDQMVELALDNGGKSYSETKDYGWMYYRTFEDLDGHQWEITAMDESKMPKEM